MTPREKIVVDTSAFYALISVSDDFHSTAAASYEVLKDRDVELVAAGKITARGPEANCT